MKNISNLVFALLSLGGVVCLLVMTLSRIPPSYASDVGCFCSEEYGLSCVTTLEYLKSFDPSIDWYEVDHDYAGQAFEQCHPNF